MAFPERFIQELVERNSIEDVVGEYVRLTKRSGANIFGLCPFHSEKTPSFSVSPSKQIYHCFGCGKGGGVINFIMEIENLSYPDAVRFLARRAGMTVPEDEKDATAGKREKMLRLNRDAARWFYSKLVADTGGPAQQYVIRRGISPAMVKSFGLGYAPDEWHALLDAMKQKGYTQMELISAGLAKPGKSGGAYDVFRNRLIFPVIDVRGSVIGFSGRMLGDGEPKYLNSPETLVYNKSRNLFALNLAKKSKSGYIILSEGNIDVVSLHQAGFDSAVASLGTSLTPEQARLISRYTQNVVIAYDNDGAGQKASERAIGILESLELKVRVLRMSGAKDPDEFIKANGPEAFRALLERSEDQVEYRLASVASNYDLKTDEGRVGFLRDATALVARLPGEVEREIYAARVANMCSVTANAVKSEVALARKRALSQSKRRELKNESRPVRAVQPVERELKYENERTALAEQGIIALLYHEPELFSQCGVTAEDFRNSVLQKLFTELKSRVDGGGDISLPMLAGAFSGDEMNLLTRITETPIDRDNAPRALEDYINKIRGEKAKATTDLLDLQKKLRATKGFGG